MGFAESTLLRMAHPPVRAALFDQVALDQILSAAYDTDALNVGGPFSAVFDDVRLGVAIPKTTAISGGVARMGSGDRWECDLRVAGAVVVADAVWRGAIVARTASPSTSIVDVRSDWPSLAAIDRDIINALGALPSDPISLELERRSRLLAVLKNGAAQPAALTTERLDAFLVESGAGTVSELLEGAGTQAVGRFVLEFAPARPQVDVPRTLPLFAAVLFRDAGFSIVQLLAETKELQRALESDGFGLAADLQHPRRVNAVVVWVVPATVFDDAAWPGGESGTTDAQRRDLRRAAAGAWLAREGIGLATIST